MKRLAPSCVLVILVGVGHASLAAAQGVQTGIVTGVVQSSDNLPLPGVTVTATSPALLGERTAVTDVNGVYFIKGLSAGTYVVSFSMDNFQPAKRENVQLTVGGTAEVNTTMALAARAETINVTAESPTPLAMTTISQSFSKTQLETMPVGRRPIDIAELAPGLTTNTFNNGQVTISGATAFDNVFMLNGVDVNDNVFGTANNLFIEDAIQDTNVLTGGISAEYGRFSGGVINLITKSGGNIFSGSFRENLSNTNWIDETPRQKNANPPIENPDILGKSSEGTFGGPIVRNRLWFFSAGRYESSNTNQTFVLSSASATRHDTNKRGEVKLTGTAGRGHTIAMDYTNNSLVQTNVYSLNQQSSLDPSVLVNPTTPNSLFVINYNGTFARRNFLTLQYSQKKFEFQDSGGTNTDIHASPIRTRGVATSVDANLHYAAPFFSALDPEQRNNRQFTGSLSRTVASRRGGTHDVKGGGEWYQSTRTGGNSQSATNYVFQTDYQVVGGTPVRDAQGVPLPVWTPGTTRVQNWMPTIGARIDINTTSLFVQDHWVPTPKLAIDAGTRFEAVRSHATGDIVTVDTTTLVPRLGVSFDIEGTGRTVLQATYAHYSGKYSEAQYAANTDVATPSRVTYGYTGPAGVGRDFAPAYNLANYATIVSAAFPTANRFVADGLSSPTVRELTFGVGRKLEQKGYVKATYYFRRWYGFLEDFIDLSNGVVNVSRNGVNVGNLTKVIYNNTDGIHREYQAIEVQHSYQFLRTVNFGASYTLQIKNEGNSNVEAANQPGIVSILGDFPEIYGPALDRLLPSGRLADYQRHKLRLYGTYTQDMGRFGSIDISPVWRVDSAATYSLSAAAVPLSAIQMSRNPGYPTNDINNMTTQTLFFGPRGSGDFVGYGLLDLAAGYGIPVWESARPWIKFEFYNLLNNDKLVRWDTTITADPNSPKDANGLPTGYIQGANFGKATADNQFARPYNGTVGGRAFRMAFGFRF